MYEKRGDAFLNQFYFDAKVPLKELQKTFCLPADDPMVDCYEIRMPHVPFLNSYTDHRFELDKCTYVLEMEAEAPSIPICVKGGEVVGIDPKSGREKDVEYVLKLE